MLFIAKMKLAAMVTAAVLLVGGAGVGTYLAAAYGAAAPKADTVGPPAAGVGLALPAATKPAAPGLTLALYSDGRSFPDGKIWKLGAQGMGRPFAVRLILTNGGKDALRIWDPDGSEGSASLGFVLTDATGRETILRTPAKARLTGLPTVWKFGGSDAPYGERARDVTVDLLQVIGERSLPPGKYRIRAFMQNAVENDGAFIKEPVWTGRIESEPTEIEISDKPATQPAAVDEARALELARGAAEEAVKGSYAAHVAAVKARGHVSPEHPDPWLSNVAPRVGRIGNGWRFEWQRTPMAGFGCQAVVEVTATGQVQVQVAKAWFSGK